MLLQILDKEKTLKKEIKKFKRYFSQELDVLGGRHTIIHLDKCSEGDMSRYHETGRGMFAINSSFPQDTLIGGMVQQEEQR